MWASGSIATRHMKIIMEVRLYIKNFADCDSQHELQGEKSKRGAR